ncbi:C16orf59 isoform 2, partial [Pan troglodytes]
NLGPLSPLLARQSPPHPIPQAKLVAMLQTGDPPRASARPRCLPRATLSAGCCQWGIGPVLGWEPEPPGLGRASGTSKWPHPLLLRPQKPSHSRRRGTCCGCLRHSGKQLPRTRACGPSSVPHRPVIPRMPPLPKPSSSRTCRQLQADPSPGSVLWRWRRRRGACGRPAHC